MRKLLLLTSFAILATLASPARAQFCPGAAPWVFDDVPAGDLFCTFITWAAEHGITQGCLIIDANHRLFCPNDAVTRSQMAAFVKRLGDVRVEAVATGPGLTGGPITSVGTINLASTQLLPTTACANNQIPRWNGSAWACGSDANSGGTVTSVGSGTGLTGGPVTTSGTLSIATAYQLPQGCANGQVAKSNGSSVWTCASDTSSGGTVTSVTAGNGLTGGTITTSGTIAVDPASTTLTGNFFRQGGNGFGATGVLGTTDNSALDIRVNGSRVMRYEPNALSPNVIGGSPVNSVTTGVRGATIAGGGAPSGADPDFSGDAPNRVTDAYGTVGGGFANRAGDNAGTANDRGFGTVGGGSINTASGIASTVGGGSTNTASSTGSTVGGGLLNEATGEVSTVAGGNGNSASGTNSTVGGGYGNAASGPNTFVGGGISNTASVLYGSVAGGSANTASGGGSAIAGGANNTASGSSSAVAGGFGNTASGHYSAIVGGNSNVASGNYSFAAGISSNADANGCFVWNDASGGSVSCGGPVTGVNRVVMRATGGFIFITNANNAVGAQLLPGANAWSIYSDRNYKDHMRDVDARSILDRLIDLPITTWNWKSQDAAIVHMGPTAQDFHATFGLGETPTMINTVDVSGVALAAIKGLNAKLEAEVARQQAEIDELKARHASEIAALRVAVEGLLARTADTGRVAMGR